MIYYIYRYFDFYSKHGTNYFQVISDILENVAMALSQAIINQLIEQISFPCVSDGQTPQLIDNACPNLTNHTHTIWLGNYAVLLLCYVS